MLLPPARPAKARWHAAQYVSAQDALQRLKRLAFLPQTQTPRPQRGP